MFYLMHDNNQFAAKGTTGERDAVMTKHIDDAVEFETYAEASEYSQNFGHEWNVREY